VLAKRLKIPCKTGHARRSSPLPATVKAIANSRLRRFTQAARSRSVTSGDAVHHPHDAVDPVAFRSEGIKAATYRSGTCRPAKHHIRLPRPDD
jgi:hypothetical protein